MKKFTGEPAQKWVIIKNSEGEGEKRTVKRLYYLMPNVYAHFKYRSVDEGEASVTKEDN